MYADIENLKSLHTFFSKFRGLAERGQEGEQENERH